MGGIYNTINSHLYHYAGNNPVKYVDPDGESPIDYLTIELFAITSGFVIGGTVGAVRGYHIAKKLEYYNGSQRDAANLAVIGTNPSNPKDNQEFTKLPDSESAFHQLDDGSLVSKYISNPDKNGGTGEIIWNDTKNELVTDPKSRGTYNYGKGKLEHGIKDVVPWILLGTGKDDPSTMGERLWDTLKAAPEFIKGLMNKKEVQE